jgi:hypothetical protein
MGCTGKEIREGVYQGIYEGARIENRNDMSPRELSTAPDMDYQQYTKERNERAAEPRKEP